MIGRGFLVLFVFFFLVWAFASGITHLSREQNADVALLETSGEGRVEVTATRAEATVSIVAHETALDDLNNRIGQASRNLQAFLSSQKAEKIRTENISVSPHTEYVNGAAKQEGFDGRITVHFECPIAQAGELVSGALGNGATAVDGVHPILSDSDREAARQQAITLAVHDAQAKTDTALAAAGLKERRIRHLSINAEMPGPIRPLRRGMMLNAMAAPAAQPMDVEGGTQEVTASAQVTVEVK